MGRKGACPHVQAATQVVIAAAAGPKPHKPRTGSLEGMCRSIKTLRSLDPPATENDVEAAALQFVRKISGYRSPSKANREVFDAAVADIAAISRHMLDHLVVRPSPGHTAS